MSAKRFGRKLLKITGIFIGILIVLLIGFHFWFKAHALKMLEDLVESRSNGKLKLRLEKFSFNYFSKKMKLEKAVFFTDSVNENTAYQFSIDKIELDARAILPIVFRNEFLIDSIRLIEPNISVTRLKEIDKPGDRPKRDVSIPEEMGKVYRSIQDALKVLKVRRFEIRHGTFNLINKIDPGQLPLTITNIDFHIDNLEVARQFSNEKILFSDNVVLNSHNQDIIFPDGRHRLSFGRFNINLKKKLVSFDSCTIAATRTDSAAASFNVFFDALQLTNIDFDTLYKSEVIKADSVYCLNPQFNLDVISGKKKGVGPPKLENIIQQLTGDLLLDHVVVNNAGFNIKTERNGVPSSFVFSNNNFEMEGLKVNQQALHPISVKSFAMAIRNYENFIKDSAYSISFDSVLFKDDRITLSNFFFNKLEKGRIINTFSIPRFNLSGLSWDELVFEQRLKAEHAIMYNPVIRYTVQPSQRKAGRQNLVQSLGALNEYMDLQQLDIVNGAIDLKMRKDLQVKLDNATVSVKSHSLLESRKLSGIKNSLTQLQFSRGVIQAGNLQLSLEDIDYVGQSGKFAAGMIKVLNKEKSTTVVLHGVEVNKMLVDEYTGDLFADGISWQNGTVDINALAATKGGATVLELSNVNGTNTIFSGNLGGKKITANLQLVSFEKLEKRPGQQLQLKELELKGDKFRMTDNEKKITIANYNIRDGASSSLTQVKYEQTGNNKASISIPSLTAIPDVSALLNGVIAAQGLNLVAPFISIHSGSGEAGGEPKQPGFPDMDLGAIRMQQPTIHFIKDKDSGRIELNWNGGAKPSNFIELTNFTARENHAKIGKAHFFITDMEYNGLKGRSFQTGKGKISASLKDIQLDQEPGFAPEWNAGISNLDATDFQLDIIGKKAGNFHLVSGTLTNLNISSALILNLQKLISRNAGFQLGKMTGSYVDANTSWRWFNGRFNRDQNSFSLDSFFITPQITRDSFMKLQPFQKDYVNIRAGALHLGRVDLEKFIGESILDAATFSLDDFILEDYRDKRLPFKGGIIKPLPAAVLNNIPQKLKLDKVELNNATVLYTEVSEKTHLSADIPITRMKVKLENLRNYGAGITDSLGIDASGYLMDSAWIRLKVKQSYLDSLGAFRMQVYMGPTDPKIFNPVIIPLEGVRIESGKMDTLSLDVTAQEYYASGEIKMIYDDLKIKFIKDSASKKGSFANWLKNFIANTFLVRKKNDSRIASVFFIRNRDRSAINYFVKTALSGVGSAVSTAGNKKMHRRHKKQLEQNNLSPRDLRYPGKPF